MRFLANQPGDIIAKDKGGQIMAIIPAKRGKSFASRLSKFRKASFQRWNAVMAILCEERLISGLTVKRFAGGAAAVFGEYPRITLKGLEYLEDSL